MISNTATSELTPTGSASVTALWPDLAANIDSKSVAPFWRAICPESETSLRLVANDFVRALRNDPANWREWEWYANLMTNAFYQAGAEIFVGLSEASSLPSEVCHPLIWKMAVERLQVLIRDCHDEPFEDGIKGPFWKGLESFLSGFGVFAVEAVQQYCFAEGSNTALVGELVRCLGLTDDPATHTARLRLLTRCLYHRAPSVRDATAIGLAYLNDKRAIDDLRRAVAREPYEELRNDLRQVVAQLET